MPRKTETGDGLVAAGNLNTPSTLYRTATLNREDVDDDARTVDLAFSSETPVERWFGQEILDHKPKSIRLDRFKSGTAPVLVDHRSADHVGVIQSIDIGKDRVGRAVVRFGKGARADEIFQDVRDGIRVNVSVGYRLHRVILEEETDDGAIYRAVDWEPLEVSIVAVPADPKVGVGRNAETDDDALVSTPIFKRSEMPKPVTQAADQAVEVAPTIPAEGIETRALPAQPAPAAPAPAVETRTVADVEKAERKRLQAILDLGKRCNLQEDAERFAMEGKSVAAFNGFIAERFAERSEESPIRPATEIGLTGREVQNFSLFRAIGAAATKDWSGAGFEKECSDAVARELDRPARGFYLPYEVLQVVAATRATQTTSTGDTPKGGYLVGTDHVGFIGMLRNRATVVNLGARVLSGLVGNIDIPKQVGAGTAYWVAEAGDTTESAAGWGQATMTPKTISGQQAISRRLAMQSSPSAEQLVREDLQTILALGIDLAAINGGGTNEPTGILQTSGIGAVAIGANGGAMTFGHVVDLETEVAVDNADIGSLAYLATVQARGKLKQTPKVSGQATYIWDKNELNGYAAVASNQVPSNGTKGPGTSLSSVIFGNFNDVVIAEWGVLDLKVDEVTLGASGGFVLRAFQDVDVLARRAQSFAACTDFDTAA